jgi:D-alanyl-D-alanine carboxypeptidase
MIADSNYITARMLLNHTSEISREYGVFVNCDFPPGPESTKNTSENPRSVLLMDYFTAEDDWFDSMTDYNLLGYIIRYTTGRTWKEEVRERIIQKLSLEDTIILHDCETRLSTNCLRRYRSPTLHGEIVLETNMVGAAGGHALVTTSGDLAVFLDAVLAGQLFQNSETLNEMLDFVDTPWGMLPPEYGLGLQKIDSPSGELIGHADNRAGLTAAVFYLADYEITIVTVINTQDWDGFTKRLLFPSLDVLVQ